MVYLLAKRPKKDQTLMSWKDVRGVGKHGANKLLIAEQFLEQNPKLKPFFTRHHEKEVLAEKIFKSGGGESRSQWSDRWGYTEKELLKDLEDMSQQGILTRREMIQAADSALKSTGRHKREYMREIYAFKRGKQDLSDTTEKVMPVKTQPRQALASLRGLKKEAIETEGAPPTVQKMGIMTIAPTETAIVRPRPFLPGRQATTASKQPEHHFLEGVTTHRVESAETGSKHIESRDIHRPAVTGLSSIAGQQNHFPESESNGTLIDGTIHTHTNSLAGSNQISNSDAPVSLRHGKLMRPGEVGRSSFPKNTGTSGLSGNVSSISRFLNSK